MTNAAHTPGPWDFDDYADHVSYFSDATKRKGDYDFRVEFPDEMPKAEAEANACLIAAAPELLEALEDMAELVEANLVTHEVHDNAWQEVFDKALAAISKARKG